MQLAAANEQGVMPLTPAKMPCPIAFPTDLSDFALAPRVPGASMSLWLEISEHPKVGNVIKFPSMAPNAEAIPV